MSSSNKKDMKNYFAGSTGIIKSSELDKIIKDVKIQIRKHFEGYKEQIQRIGDFLKEKKLVKEEDICSEIKNVLRDEIKEKLVSSDTIEKCCPDEWKRKTRPKDNGDPQLRIFEGKNQVEQEQETVTSTNLSIASGGQVLQQEHRASDSKLAERQPKQKERQFEKVEQQHEEIIKDLEKELEKLRPLIEEQQEQESRLRKENVDLKEQLEKLREENTKFRAELDESKKQGQLKVSVDEWTLSKQLLSLRHSGYTKLQIIIENGKYVKIEGGD